MDWGGVDSGRWLGWAAGQRGGGIWTHLEAMEAKGSDQRWTMLLNGAGGLGGKPQSGGCSCELQGKGTLGKNVVGSGNSPWKSLESEQRELPRQLEDKA